MSLGFVALATDLSRMPQPYQVIYAADKPLYIQDTRPMNPYFLLVAPGLTCCGSQLQCSSSSLGCCAADSKFPGFRAEHLPMPVHRSTHQGLGFRAQKTDSQARKLVKLVVRCYILCQGPHPYTLIAPVVSRGTSRATCEPCSKPS